MENSFSDIRSKLVVNLIDGQKLGPIVDLIFEKRTAKILGVIVPGTKNFFSFFKPKEDIFIPYHNICKIGEDTILVQLTPTVNITREEKSEKYDYLSPPQFEENK